MPPETVQALLSDARQRLGLAGCETPALDARLLLQRATGKTREDFILEPGRLVEGEALHVFNAMIARRVAREPVSRILGEREFFGRLFRVTPDVLDPRADTETLIGAALAVLKPQSRILDLGTGTGAIIVTLLAELPDASGVATDQSAAALAVARGNALRLGVAGRLQLLEGDWFWPVSGRFDLIASNPPYIPDGEIAALAPDVRDFDPRAALAGGDDGLQPYRAIAGSAGGHLTEEGKVMVEIGAGQAKQVEAIFARAGFMLLGQYGDLGGHVRCLSFCKL